MNAPTRPSAPGRFGLAIVELTLMIVSLALIGAIGLSEAHGNYATLQRQTIRANGTIVHHQIERLLQGGIPLAEISNIKSLIQPLLAQPMIDRVVVFGVEQTPLIDQTATDQDESADWATSAPVNLILQSRTGVAGQLALYSHASHVSDFVWEKFSWLIPVSLAVVVVVPLLVYWLTLYRGYRRSLVRNILHAVSVSAVLVGITGTLLSIYSHGIQGKIEGLATALQSRLESPLRLGIPLDSFTGFDQILDEYRQKNAEIHGVVIKSPNRVIAQTRAVDGSSFEPNRADYYRISRRLMGSETTQTSATPLYLELWFPKTFLYSRLWNALKNLMTLLLALLLLARLFQSLASSVESRLTEMPINNGYDHCHPFIARAKPFFALVVLAEGLNASFLPRFFVAHVGETMASLLFTAYFAAFALAVLPAGRYADKYGPSRLLHLGLLFIAIGLGTMAWVHDLVPLLIARILCGAGQGMVYIGTQAFVLRTGSSRGMEGLVVGAYVGLISGTALGALLVRYSGESEVFTTGSAIVLLALLYACLLLRTPSMDKKSVAEAGSIRTFTTVIKDRQFLKAMFLASFPTKMTYTGVFVLTIPILLKDTGYDADDIGQIMLFYAIGVLAVTQLLPHLSARGLRHEQLLVTGLWGSSLGLLLLATTAGGSVIMATGLRTLALIASIAFLGACHGLIVAPALQYAVSAPAAQAVGPTATAASYRLLDRIGQTLGPAVIGPMILLAEAKSTVILWLAVLMSGMAAILSFLCRASRPVETEKL